MICLSLFLAVAFGDAYGSVTLTLVEAFSYTYSSIYIKWTLDDPTNLAPYLVFIVKWKTSEQQVYSETITTPSESLVSQTKPISEHAYTINGLKDSYMYNVVVHVRYYATVKAVTVNVQTKRKLLQLKHGHTHAYLWKLRNF